MKKLILSIAMIASAVAVSAQYKPEAGDVTTGVDVQLFNDAENIQMNKINVRYFINDGFAVRAALGFGMNATSSFKEDIAAKTEDSFKSNRSQFGIDLGIEKHFNVAPRLSPYIGAELGFATTGYSATSEHIDNGPATATYTIIKYKGIDNGTTGLAGNGFRVGIFTGVDFYMYKGLYAGVEYGVGYQTTWNGSWQIETKTNAGTTTTKSDDNGKKKSSVSGIAIQAAPSFKLGWKF